MDFDKILSLAPVGLLAVGIISNNGGSNFRELAQSQHQADLASQIETEATEAGQALAQSRIDSGACLPTDEPIKPGMRAVGSLPVGACLIDSQGMTATTDRHGNLINLAAVGVGNE